MSPFGAGLVALVWSEGVASKPGDLRARLEPSFLRWWLPNEFVALDEIPKTSVGKVYKAELRRRHGGAEG